MATQATAEELQKRVERYKGLLASRSAAGAPPERIRLFRKKMKRFQRRLRKARAGQQTTAASAEAPPGGEATS